MAIKRYKVTFEDNGQDLTWMLVEKESNSSDVCVIVDAPFVNGCIYAGNYCDMRTVEKGKHLGILNYEKGRTDFIKYKISEVEQVNLLSKN